MAWAGIEVKIHLSLVYVGEHLNTTESGVPAHNEGEERC